jgi:hypothetical protein
LVDLLLIDLLVCLLPIDFLIDLYEMISDDMIFLFK